MFGGEYNAEAIREAQKAKKRVSKACIACARAFAPEVFKDCADRINSRAKLVTFLAWISDHHVGVQDKENWIKSAMHTFDLSFKKGIL